MPIPPCQVARQSKFTADERRWTQIRNQVAYRRQAEQQLALPFISKGAAWPPQIICGHPRPSAVCEASRHAPTQRGTCQEVVDKQKTHCYM